MPAEAVEGPWLNAQALPLFPAIGIFLVLGEGVERADHHHLGIEDAADLFPDQIVNALHVDFGHEALLHAVDHRQLLHALPDFTGAFFDQFFKHIMFFLELPGAQAHHAPDEQAGRQHVKRDGPGAAVPGRQDGEGIGGLRTLLAGDVPGAHMKRVRPRRKVEVFAVRFAAPVRPVLLQPFEPGAVLGLMFLQEKRKRVFEMDTAEGIVELDVAGSTDRQGRAVAGRHAAQEDRHIQFLLPPDAPFVAHHPFAGADPHDVFDRILEDGIHELFGEHPERGFQQGERAVRFPGSQAEAGGYPFRVPDLAGPARERKGGITRQGGVAYETLPRFRPAHDALDGVPVKFTADDGQKSVDRPSLLLVKTGNFRIVQGRPVLKSNLEQALALGAQPQAALNIFGNLPNLKIDAPDQTLVLPALVGLSAQGHHAGRNACEYQIGVAPGPV